MPHTKRLGWIVSLAVVVLLSTGPAALPQNFPNPYRLVEDWHNSQAEGRWVPWAV